MKRTILGFIVAPVAPLLLFWAGFTVHEFVLAGPKSLTWTPLTLVFTIALGAPVAYAVTLVLGVPVYLLLRWLWNPTVGVMLSVGIVLGALTMFALSFGNPWAQFGPQMAVLGKIPVAVGAGAIMGAAAGFTFGWIALRPRGSPAPALQPANRSEMPE